MIINSIQLNLYLTLGLIFFCLGIYGVLTKRNLIGVLMSIEIIFNAANLNLIAFSRFIKANFDGQLFSLFVIAIVAAETVVALAIIIAVYKKKDTLDTGKLNLLKW